ncbi:hypothetical protein I7I48_02529 [Histoplasma ohiense]|nr:hypothetical protein I7I48_02529 [Histoplasma ohiense (nom. inval.)]
MRTVSHIFVLCSLILLVSCVGASQGDGRHGVAQPIGLARRQDNEGTTDKPQKTGDSTITDAPTGTGDSTATGGNTNENTGKTTGAKETGTKGTKTSKPKSTKVPVDAPAGGVKMVQPAITDPATYIKIGSTATFKWNYTSLIITPSAVEVVASCSKNSHAYTISGNMSVQETAQVVWDTGRYRTSDVPLLTEDYTLMVYDSSKDPSDIPQPGHLGAQSPLIFGMYYPQPYTPRNDFVCAGCNTAVSDMERQALKFIVGMATVTVLSFTWFVTGAGTL